jgi:hypothetical protein
MGKERASILKEIICAVMVVPMFAPMIMPIAWRRVRSPAFTKPTVITEVALLLWIITVVNRPISNVDQLFLARKFIMVLSLLEAIFCKLLLNLLMPNINNDNPARLLL